MKEMHITIKEAGIDDVSAVAVLFDFYRQFYEQPSNLSLATAFIAERVSKKESVILLATDSKLGLVGFCQLYPTFCSVEAKPIYTLYDLFVLPTARMNGVGQMLLRAAEVRARLDGRARMDLTTAKNNHQAQRLYESMGWVRDDVFFTYNRRIDAQSDT